MIEDRKQFGQLLKDKKLNGYGVELGVAAGHFSNHILNTSSLKVLKDVFYLWIISISFTFLASSI